MKRCIETFLIQLMLFYVCREWSVGVSVWEKSATASAFFSYNGNRQPSRPEGQSPDNEKKNTGPAMNNQPKHTVLGVDLRISTMHFCNNLHSHVAYSYFAIICTLQQLDVGPKPFFHVWTLLPDTLTNVQRLNLAAVSLI